MKTPTVILLILGVGVSTAFSPSPIRNNNNKIHSSTTASNSRLFATAGIATKANTKKESPVDKYIRAPIDKVANSLPWNAKRMEVRSTRKLRRELTLLHRYLGVPDNVSYEELKETTDALIDEAGSDIKRKVMIEMKRDDILQLRLNERVAGLAKISSEAQSATSIDEGGKSDIEIVEKKTKFEEEQAKAKKDKEQPKWMNGLIVRNDDEWKMKKIKQYGIMALLGIVFPFFPIPWGQLFLFFVVSSCMLQRGVPMVDAGGFGNRKMFSTADTSHHKVAWVLTFAISIAGKVIAFGMTPKKLMDIPYWGISTMWVLECIVDCVACYYLKPYQGVSA